MEPGGTMTCSQGIKKMYIFQFTVEENGNTLTCFVTFHCLGKLRVNFFPRATPLLNEDKIYLKFRYM